jgi:hypothetical protein
MIRALFSFFVIAAAGCTYGDRAAFETSQRPQTNPQTIQVLDRQNIKRPYKVIGLVTSESYYLRSAMKSIRKEASELGADAIIDFGPSGNQTGVGLATAGGAMLSGIGGSYNTGWAGKAIVWE